MSSGGGGHLVASATSSTEFHVNIPSGLEVIIPDVVELPITPTSTGTFAKKDFNIVVSTNNLTGYTLTSEFTQSTLTNNSIAPDPTNPEINIIPSITSNTTESTFPTNNWGIAINPVDTSNITYSKINTDAGGHLIKTTTAPINKDTTTIVAATKVDLTKPSGIYTNTLDFKAVANFVPTPIVTSFSPDHIPVGNSDTHLFTINGNTLDLVKTIKIGTTPCTNIKTNTEHTTLTCELGQDETIASITTSINEAYNEQEPKPDKDPTTGFYHMQDMDTTIKNKVDSPIERPNTPIIINGETVTTTTINYYQEATLVDKRDNKTYTVAKLADDNIWMNQNLDLDLDENITYTNADTDLNSVTRWKPASSTIPDTSINHETGVISGWQTDNHTPYSVDTGNYYFDGIYHTSKTCNYITASCKHFVAEEETEKLHKLNGMHGHVGNYYNWPAAVATNKTTTDLVRFEQMPDSICPKNWRLPSLNGTGSTIITSDYGILTTAYGATSSPITDGDNDEKILSSPIFMTRSGLIYSPDTEGEGALANAGYNGYYLTNTSLQYGTYAYLPWFSSADLHIGGNSMSSRGFIVRCLVR